MTAAAQFLAAGVPSAFVDAVTLACEHFLINTPARLAGFVAQCRVESSEFTALTEDLNYTHADHIQATFPREVPTLALAATLVGKPELLANTVYANRLGNGGVASGDGWRFIGRGICQLTGRAEYAAASAALNRPYLTNPGLVAQPTDACLTAAWYWANNRCNEHADVGDWDGITRLWNGEAMLQATRRAALSAAGIPLFS